MRKRTVKHVADTIFWYSLYMLPLVVFVFFNLSVLKNVNYDIYANGYLAFPYNFDWIFTDVIGFESFSNPVFNALLLVFADDGLFPSFVGYGVIQYGAYFISVFILHLMVDFILFIPRLAHKWLKGFTEGDD